MEIKDKILEAALQVFAETGYRGATTRRIAQLADVNEVTLFRHFGSKDDLIHAALHREVGLEPPLRLPEHPGDAEAELTEWAEEHYRRLLVRAPMLRVCIGESAEHPEMTGCVSEGPLRLAQDLRRYLGQVCARNGSRANCDVLTTLLMSALFADAVTRPMVPGLFTASSAKAPGLYVRTLLNAMGAGDAKS